MDTEEDAIKVILVGETGTGKTCLINTAQGKPFIEGEEIPSSMTCYFIELKLKILGEDYKINLWDTIGQEKFRSLTKVFFKNANIVIFVFDITNKDSFKALDYWFETIDEELGNEPIRGLAANKQDLYNNQEVTDDEIKEYANKKGIKYTFTTATNPAGFNRLLENLMKMYLEKIGTELKQEKKDGGKKLKNSNNNNNKKKKNCC